MWKIRIGLVAILVLTAGTAASEEIQFNRDIRPLLSDRCFHCHGPDENDRQAGLRLDLAEGPEGAHSFAIQPGSLDESELYQRILSDDPDSVMPPPDSHKKPLSDAEKKLIAAWIKQGAKYESFWAFLPPTKPKLPANIEGAPIDRFVRRQLRQKQMSPTPLADKRTLIRRLTFDLTGLPPTRKEIDEFLNDDSAKAYENVVDRLLDSPHYGEHMARYWLDLVRFADTNGIHHDHYRDLSPYRDWVIRAFNDDLPYDDFIRYQLAGDLYPQPTRDQLVASGFHRLHLIIDVGTALPEESFTRNVLDRVTSVGTAFMGLTVQCAVCHDHKYDPLTMKEFYSLSAFFNNIDAQPETGGRRGTDFRRGLQQPYINLTNEAQELELARLEDIVSSATALLKQRRATQKQLESEKAKDGTANPQLEDQLKRAQSAVKQAEQDHKTAKQNYDNYLIKLPAAMIMKERVDIRPAHVLIRGAYDNPGEQVSRATPAFLPPMKPAGDVATRMDLANWFASPEHPLTARVAVNRFWQQLFGVGIVRTSEDFGAQGEWPSHPDLLDYLTVQFTTQDWSVRKLMKEIVMSETYRQSSDSTPESYSRDPDNRLLARGSRYRMDSEMIRDHVLASSGKLNRKMFGKSVKPPQPEGLWTAVSMPSSYPRKYEPDSGNQIFRRSLYTFWKRGMPPPQMTILNAPSREECIARRERTNTPLQALLLLNETEYLKASRNLALHVLEKHPGEAAERIEIIYETITSYLPTESELTSFQTLLVDLEKAYGNSPALAAQLCGDVDLPAKTSREQLAAWTILTSSIYNLDISKTRQ